MLMNSDQYSYSINSNNQQTFTIDFKNHIFLKNDQPFHYVSGSIHYFRIPSIYWYDRLYKAKAAGLDAIQIYIPWNYHEPELDKYQFDGDRNLEKFLQLAANLNLFVIARVGPYICAEWSFGGLPPWLLRINPNMILRSSDVEYFGYVKKWFDVLLPKLKSYLYQNGGPIIMIQLENEYGSYGRCDKIYMSNLYDLARTHLGDKIILFTTDGPSLLFLVCGSPDPRYLATIDFGPNQKSTEISFESLEHFRPNQPWVNSEFYVGWFDAWNRKHATVDTKVIVNSLTQLMNYSQRVNVNLYMFHGGTNFGYWNGAGEDDAMCTSYDYDAPLSESGEITEKYVEIRNLLFKLKGIDPPPLPSNVSTMAYGIVNMEFIFHILEIDQPAFFMSVPVNMEQLYQYESFTIYRANIQLDQKTAEISFTRLADIVHVYTADEAENYVYYASLRKNETKYVIHIPTEHKPWELVFLVENTGYINYGNKIENDIKGIIGEVLMNGKALNHWTVIPVRNTFEIKPSQYFDQKTNFEQMPNVGSHYIGILIIKSEAQLNDSFIELNSFTRGVVSINNQVLGRYDQKRGPQLRLYVPRSYFTVGDNLIDVIELEQARLIDQKYFITFHDQMLWK